ncbi:MAG: hypothetical protein ACRCVL_07950, partial [Cetobacterium sp.]
SDCYPIRQDAFMWPNVNGTVLTNQIAIRSEKTHEVTRCKNPLRHHANCVTVYFGFYCFGIFIFIFFGLLDLLPVFGFVCGFSLLKPPHI